MLNFCKEKLNLAANKHFKELLPFFTVSTPISLTFPDHEEKNLEKKLYRKHLRDVTSNLL